MPFNSHMHVYMDVEKLCVDKWKMATCNGSTIVYTQAPIYFNSRCCFVLYGIRDWIQTGRSLLFSKRNTIIIIIHWIWMVYGKDMYHARVEEGERQIWWAYTPMWKKGLLSGLPFYVLCMRLWWNYFERIAIWMATWIHRVQSFCLFIYFSLFLFARVSRFFLSLFHTCMRTLYRFFSARSLQINGIDSKLNGINILPIEHSDCLHNWSESISTHAGMERQRIKKAQEWNRTTTTTAHQVLWWNLLISFLANWKR